MGGTLAPSAFLVTFKEQQMLYTNLESMSPLYFVLRCKRLKQYVFFDRKQWLFLF